MKWIVSSASLAMGLLAFLLSAGAEAAQAPSVIDVFDRGSGFSNEALQNALLPLYSTKVRGSGTGLALSREIAEAHGGSISIRNRSDGGGHVRLMLPARSNSGTHLTRSRLTLSRQGPGP